MKNCLHSCAFGFTRRLALLPVVVFSLFAVQQSFGQCGIASSPYAGTGVALTPAANDAVTTTTLAGSGTYLDFSVGSGNIYSFYFDDTVAGIANDYWDMTLANTSAIIGYNDAVTLTPVNIANDYHGGFACPTTTRPASAEWYSTYSGTLNVAVNTYNGGCLGYIGSGVANSAALSYRECVPTADPGPGTGNNWIVDAYASFALSIPNLNARYGYYTDATSLLHFKSTNYYTAAQVPSKAATWTSTGSCIVPPENWTIRARRTGLPCGVYTFVVNSADDSVGIYINGAQIGRSACCIGSATTLGSTVGYQLTTTDIIEVRQTGVCGNNNVDMTITPVSVPALTGGSIGTNQTICAGSTPAALTNVTSPTGGVSSTYVGGGYTYDWFEEVNCAPPVNDLNSNTAGYTFPAGVGNTICLGRTVSDGCGVAVSSNTVIITVNQPSAPPGGTSATSSTICLGQSDTLSVSGGTLGTGASWVWYAGGCGSGSSIGSGPTLIVTPGTTTTYYVRAENPAPCSSPTTCASVTVTVNTASTAPTSVNVTNSTICSGTGSTTLTEVGGALGSGATWTWYSGVCGGTFVGTGTSITVSPTNTTTYYVRAATSGPCGSSTCASTTITVNQPSTAPSEAIATSNTICLGSSDTLSVSGGLLGTGATWVWYAGGCGSGSSIGSGPSIIVTPGTTTSYYVRAENPGPCALTTTCAVVTVTVNTASTAATSVNGTSNLICSGSKDTLTVVGGSLGTGANWVWYNGGCGGVSAGSGTSIVVSPSSTTTYYVRAETTGPCINATACVSFTITVNQPSGNPASISATASPSCSGLADTLTVNGGSLGTGATWVWYAGGCGTGGSINTGTSIIVNPTSTTTYYVRAENLGICPSPTNCASTTVTVLQPSTAPTGISGVDTVCHGTSTSLTVVGGSLGAGALWTWYTGSCGGTFIATGSSVNVTPGATTTYYVNAVGTCNTTSCVDTAVIVNPLPVGFISGTTSICNGTSTLITFNFTVGTGPFNIIYTDGTNLYTLNGVTNGTTVTVTPTTNSSSSTTTTYTFTSITDANGCIATSGFTGGASITVTPLPIIDQVNETDVLCFGGNTGIISISVSSGTPPIFYSIDSGVTFQTNNTFDTGITIGSYYIIVKDAQTCSTTYAVNPVVVNQPTPVTQIDTIVDASCANVFNGSISITASGGTPGYTYSLNGGPTQPGNQFTGLASGNYIVQVYDSHNCLDTTNVTINNSYVLEDSVVTQTNISCYGLCNGSVTVELSGGTPPYQYSSNGSIFTISPIFNNLCAQPYIITLRDSKGCTAFLPVTVTQPNQLSANIDSTANVLCNGTATGSLFTSVTGGTPPYTFLWSNGDTTQNDTGLVAGTYTVTVQDAHNCSTFVSGTISQPLALFVNIASYTNLNCFNDSMGAILINVSGGLAPYAFTWSNGDTTQGISGLKAGTYYVTVTDHNTCQQEDSQLITQPLQLTSTISDTNVSCNGGSNGAVELTVSGGTTPYSFNWNNGATTQNLSNLTAGNYAVIISDAHGCTISNSIVVTQPNAIGLSIAPISASCSGSTVNVNLTVSGGTPGYTFSWNSGTYTTQNLTGVGAGKYVVVVTDTNSCTATDSITVTQPAVLTLSDTITNVSCAGAANGSITLTIGGGTTPYSYLWSNGDTTATAGNLSGNTYTVVVTDANLCTIGGTFVVGEPAALTGTISSAEVTCPGAANGTASVSVSGGTGPYTYLWSTFQTTDSIHGLSGGTYYIIATDAHGCKFADSVVITQPNPFNLVINAPNASCSGSIVNVTLTVSGGTPNYGFSWNGGTYTTQNLTGVGAGKYVVVVTDANSCTATDSITVTQPAVLTLSDTITNVSCNGAANGSITLTIGGGTTPYSYLWSNNDTTATAGNLSGNTYTVVVTDANLCTISGTFTVNEPVALSGSISSTEVTCPGAANGTASVSVNGGTGPYTYLWSTFQTTDSIAGLSGGTYYVIATDAHGCKFEDSVVITQPNPFNLVISAPNASCSGSTVNVNLTVSGGTPNYGFSWNGGIYTTQNLTGVGAGKYVVVVTDANSCTATDSITVTQPAVLTLSDTITNVSCAGAANGSITLTIGGGTTPYSYLWSNNDTTATAGNLSGNTYTVVVTDANLCTISGTFTVNEPVALSGSISSTEVTCPGAANGTASVSVSGGTGSYTYLWSTFQTTDSIAGLSGGTYYVIATDAHGCKLEDSTVITQPAAFVINLSVTNALCHGDSGSITLTVSGGTGADTYSWNGGAYTTQNLSSVPAGTYTVVITDANHCTVSDSATITQPTALVLNGTAVSVACAGGHDGSVSITVNGGVFPYSYLWSNTDTTQNINGLSGGTYTVTVTDANGCKITASFTINEPTALTSTISGTNVTCPGEANGTASVSASGGSQPYTYLWNTFQTSDTIIDLAGGTYYVIVTDNNGCKNEDSIVITQPAPFVINLSVTNALCHGDSGSITLTVSGGTGADTYSWNGGAYTTQNLSSVPAGTYTVVITDANHCTVSDSATITQPTALVLNGTAVSVACAGGHDGSVSITVNGGVFPYSYLWSNTDTTENINGLNGGTYTVTVTDANGCKITASFTINEPTALTSTISGTNVTCPGEANGTASVSASGGSQPYTYLWNTFQTSDTINGLMGGTYYVIVTDNNGCKNEDSIVITQPAPFVINLSVTNALCHGDSGSITLTVSGGTGADTYSWNGGAYTTQNLSSVPAGTYTVVITDANHCTVSDSATITQPTALVLNGTAVSVACAGGHDGSVSITVNGGVFPYSYLWSNTDTTENINGLNGGTYTVTVTDANGCMITASFTINEPIALTSIISGTNVTCPGEGNGTATVSASGGSQPYTYLWNTFQTTGTITGLGRGTYYVIVTDNNGCKNEDSTVITEPLPFVLNISSTGVLCNGGSTGNVTLTVSGATPGYTFSWNNGAYTTQDLSNVPAGNYDVVITDDSLCTVTDSIIVTQPNILAAVGLVQNVHCAGGNDGAVDLSVTGGTTPYSYAWSNGDSLVNAGNLPIGPISVTVTDFNLCTASAAFNVSEPTPITDTIMGTGVAPCHGSNNGSATMTVSGGTPPYSFLWSNFAASQNISGLSGGTYFVLITDSNGCTHRDSVIIAEPALLTLSVSTTNISCFNDSNGVIVANVGGGNTPYNYQWSNIGAPDSSVDSHLTGGNYSITVTDATNCSASASATVINPPLMVTNFVVHNDQCFGDTNGSIILIQSGGTPNYSFRWSNGDTTQDIANLAADTFTVTVTDSRGCINTGSAIVIQPGALYTSGVIKNVTCKGDNDGNVVITAYGGTLPYSYQWVDSTTGTDIATTQNIYGVSGGNYYVTVTDLNNCFVVSQYIVTEPQKLTDTLTGTNATCFGGNNGTAANIPGGGTVPYAYLWNDFVTDSARGGLTAGLYTVILTDSNGCHLYDSIQITQPTAINIAAVVDSAQCFGSATGSVTTTVTGGTPGYTYLWSNSVTNASITAEDAGDYTVTATDNVGCTALASFAIGQPSRIFTTMLFDEPTCYGAGNGSVSVVAEQGILPYTYNWSTTPAQTAATAAQLTAGSYTVTVTDANSCTITASETLIQPDSIAVSTNVQAARCFNTASGGVIATVVGGTGPYIYELNGVLQSSDTFIGLTPGNYLLLVTDLNGCDGRTGFQVSAPSTLAVTLSTTDQIILTGMQTQLIASAVPDTGILHYIWTPLTLDSISIFDFSGCGDSTNCSSPLVSPQFSQIFTVTVENSDSCFVSDTITIYVDNQPASFIPSAFTPNNDGLNDRFEFAILGANAIEISIFDRWGERVYYNPNQNNGMNNTDGWDGSKGGKPAPEGTYVYQMKVTYFDGTVKNKTGTVAILR